MDPSSVIQLIVLIVLIFLSGFFSSAETALTTVNINKLKAIADETGRRAHAAKRVLKMRENSSKLLSTVLVGNNIVNMSASALMTVFCTDLFGSKFIGVATGVLTFIVLIIGEIMPKTLATLHNVSMALFFSRPISFLMIVFTPIIWLLNIISTALFKLFRIRTDVNPDQMTESELRKVVDVSGEEGVIEPSEKKMINNVVDFGDAVAKDIMIPRADMIALDVDADLDEVLDVIKEENYSRIPIFKESKDHISGILHVKDLILREKSFKDGEMHIADIMRKPVFVYEYQRTAQIFADMKLSATSMCIVLDEYGITAGIITMEDLIEEIVGDIRDEYDAGENELIRKVSENKYSVEGAVKLDDLNDAIGTTMDSENYDSIGGLVIELLDRLPEEGDAVTFAGGIIRVKEVIRNRVERVEIELLPEEEDENEASE